MTTGLWVLFWVLVVLVFVGILLWAAKRKPIEPEQESRLDAWHREMDQIPEPSPHSYLADIYPVTGEYPKPLTGIQKAAVEREFAAGSTAAPEVNVVKKKAPAKKAKPVAKKKAKKKV
jgi:hypothetical protein